MITDLKKRAIHRSRILQGQLQGLEKMIEKEEYCIDILTQSLAIQKSLASLDKLILENHLNTHVKDQLAGKGKKSAEETVEELLNLYELHNIRGK
jgi:CsoR family transcriptional regulator, copper-sensing transcriptional repressor